VIRAIAALALLSASSVALATTTKTAPASGSDALVSSTPWWERITVTVAGDGQSHSCLFESSLEPNGAKDCDVVGSEAVASQSSGQSSGAKDQYTRISFERRFTPGAQPASGDLQLGDRLLGRQVMALAIDAGGAVKGCKIVAASGVMTPDYGCAEASAERFQASAAKDSDSAREGTMTILVYGHAEHVV
jgi:hypothetical protein